MGISVEEAIHELRNREEVFVAYSQATKLPYVTCDEETFNDQARIFATEEEIKEYGKQLLEDKILLMGMKYEKKDYPRLSSPRSRFSRDDFPAFGLPRITVRMPS